jgi:uncharacterized protein HemX
MKSFVKSALFSAVGIGCLALGSGAQQPAPTPPASPAPPAPVIYGQGGTALIPGQGAYTGRFATTEGGTTVWYGTRHDHETMTIAKQLAGAKETEREELREKLVKALEKAFDDRQKTQEKEIAALEKQVAKLKEMVSKRQEAKKEIITERVKQLEREAKGLGW